MTTTLTLATVAQAAGPLNEIGATARGLLVGTAALLAGMVAAAVTVWALIALFRSLFDKPTWEKLAGIVAIAIAAAYIGGALPGWIGSAYTAGRGGSAALVVEGDQ